MANKRIYALTETTSLTDNECFLIDKSGNTDATYTTMATIKAYINDGMATTTELADKADDTAVVHNTGSESIAGTKHFTGILKIPTLATAPTPEEGMMYFDTVDKHFYGYNGTIWKQLDN